MSGAEALAFRSPIRAAAQEALLRSLTAGRRLLVVLDHVRDADHVRPLLPAGPATCTVITSRDRLTDLVARVDALPIALDLPDHAEAAELLLRRVCAPQAPEAVSAIIEACGRLPLALALVAARARQTGFALAAADHYRQGLLAARATADPVMEARLSLHLGDAYQAVGDETGARDWWRLAHEILAGIGHPQAAEAGRRLAAA